ncbi:hypothetical protein PS623_00862 [Pseudomonas fluorescens]|uniref:hypothetical protein n=1 Tax=Pseudomonas TaxID=286 RepID=UPI00125AE26C|nr:MULTISPECIES: hypothetical protein [Pseudomonas]MBA1197774.1 hypothetical protein [Pseudomonas plecoglossicida]VVM53030.1 hypothetical protein PS623_00862 [Pseudomonas fluorescens]
MHNPADKQHQQQTPSKSAGEAERDNDALRPDGSTGTEHDSTAQKTARQEDQQRK